MTYDIIVATYNGENYLQQQLMSLLNQTVLPEHIFIRDDLSNDKTIAIIEDFANSAHVPVVFLKPDRNLGYIKNFEVLSKKALADIIFFCDQDDIWLSNKAELIIQEFKTNPECKMIFSDAYLVDEKLDMISTLWHSIGFKPKREECNLSRVISDNFVTGATIAIERNYLLSLLPFPDNIIHDYWLAVNSIVDNNIFYIEEKLILYRQHQFNQIGVKNKGFLSKAFNYYSKAKVLDRMNYGKNKLLLIRELLRRRPELTCNDTIVEYVLYCSFLNKIYGGAYSGLFFSNELKACLNSGKKSYSFMSYLRKRRFKNLVLDFFDFAFFLFLK